MSLNLQKTTSQSGENNLKWLLIGQLSNSDFEAKLARLRGKISVLPSLEVKNVVSPEEPVGRGIKAPNPAAAQKRIDQLEEAYRAGDSINALVNRFKINPSTVYNRTKQRGVIRRISEFTCNRLDVNG